MSVTQLRPPLSRRAALTRLLLAHGLGASPAQPQRLGRAGNPKHVVVMGAGLAGLAAAYELMRAGHQVTVLEARDRPGGRVETLREPFSKGVHAEAGAVRIADVHRLTLHYAGEFGLPLEPHRAPGDDTYLVKGRRLRLRRDVAPDWPFDLTPEERRLGLDGMYSKYLLGALEGIETEPAVWPPIELRQHEKLTIEELLRSRGASPAALELLSLDVRDPHGSAIWGLAYELLLRGAGQWFRIRGGNDRLPHAFARRLEGRIRYGCPVVAFRNLGTKAEALIERDGQREGVRGDFLICTLPASILKDMELTSEWMRSKARAISHASYVSASRVFFETRTRFWLRDGLSGFAVTDLPLQKICPGAGRDPAAPGLLHTDTANEAAVRFAAMAPEERLRVAADQIGQVFPRFAGDRLAGASKCWDQDPWAKGAYITYTPGQMEKFYPEYRGRQGRLYFAGEHSSPWSGWMEGAIESGLRAAREVNEAS